MHNELATASDAALLHRAHTGDAVAFGDVYDRHAAAALRLADRMLYGRSVAEDVVQESFLSLWRAGEYDPRHGTVRSYLMSIVHNRAIDRLRRDGRQAFEAPLDAGYDAAAPGGTHLDAEQRDVRRVVRESMAALPAAQRRVLELAYFGGLTQLEIAMVLGEPIGTIKSRMRLGLEKLGRDANIADCR